MGRTCENRLNAPPPWLIESSREQRPPISRSNNRRAICSCSTSRSRNRWVSKFHQRCWRWPTRWSNDEDFCCGARVHYWTRSGRHLRTSCWLIRWDGYRSWGMHEASAIYPHCWWRGGRMAALGPRATTGEVAYYRVPGHEHICGLEPLDRGVYAATARTRLDRGPYDSIRGSVGGGRY